MWMADMMQTTDEGCEWLIWCKVKVEAIGCDDWYEASNRWKSGDVNYDTMQSTDGGQGIWMTDASNRWRSVVEGQGMWMTDMMQATGGGQLLWMTDLMQSKGGSCQLWMTDMIKVTDGSQGMWMTNLLQQMGVCGMTSKSTDVSDVLSDVPEKINVF